jgi:hypothetical protein
MRVVYRRASPDPTGAVVQEIHGDQMVVRLHEDAPAHRAGPRRFDRRAVGDAAPETPLDPGAVDRSSHHFAAGSCAVTVTWRIVHRLRLKARRYLAANPQTDPTSFATPGDAVTVRVP